MHQFWPSQFGVIFPIFFQIMQFSSLDQDWQPSDVISIDAPANFVGFSVGLFANE
jgi:hypothetical protein